MRRRIIGYGNPFRRDDAVGLEVAKKLQPLHLPETEVISIEGDGLTLLEILRDCRGAVLIDALHSGDAPGTLRCIQLLDENIPDEILASTHAVGIRQAIELGKKLRCLPSRVTLYGIAGKDFSLGQGLTPPVQSAAEQLVRILSELP